MPSYLMTPIARNNLTYHEPQQWLIVVVILNNVDSCIAVIHYRGRIIDYDNHEQELLSTSHRNALQL